MKKLIALILTACLLLLPILAMAEETAAEETVAEETATEEATAEETATEALTNFEWAESLYALHAARHPTSSIASGPEDAQLVLAYRITPDPDAMFTSTELTIPEARKRPTNTKTTKALFEELFGAAINASMVIPEVNIVNMDILEGQYGGKVSLVVAGQSWWMTDKRGDDEKMMAGPLFMLDAEKNIIGNTIYSLCFFHTADTTRIWLCSDPDIVRDMLAPIREKAIKDDKSKNSKLVQEWLLTADNYTYIAPEPTEEPDSFFIFTAVEPVPTEPPATEPETEPETEAAPAATPATAKAVPATPGKIIGFVTVNSGKSVNLRDTGDQSGNVVGQGKAGATYSCVGIADSGWYEIIFGSEHVFVSPGVVTFVPN